MSELKEAIAGKEKAEKEAESLHCLLASTFDALTAVNSQLMLIDETVVNSDEIAERYLVELRLMIDETLGSIADELPDLETN